jgi:cyclase
VGDIAAIRGLLTAGAEKVSLNTAAVKCPDLISGASRKFGSQCIVVAIDAKLVQGSKFRVQSNEHRTMNHEQESKKWEVYINGGRTPTELDALEWAKTVTQLGAGEILLTSMDYDGTKDGFDIPLTRAITEAINIPVIASGGAGRLEHFYDVFSKGGADAGLAASIFHYQEYSVRQVKEYLKEKGVAVRL